MYRLRENEVSALEIAQFLNADLTGPNFIVTKPRTLTALDSRSVVLAENIDEDKLTKLKQFPDVLVITGTAFPADFTVIVTQNPKLAFVRVINEFFAEQELASIHSSAIVHNGANLGRNVSVGAGCVIGADVEIDEETEIQNGVVICGSVRIGRRCLIKSGATIGSGGYGFVSDEHGRPVPFPQCGRIVIGDQTWIGANATIERSPFADTVIEDNVKIDDLVHIGNGSKICENTMITAGVVVSESVRVGRKCWLMPGARVSGSISIADRTTIGIGSVVLNNVTEEDSVYVGNPARRLSHE